MNSETNTSVLEPLPHNDELGDHAVAMGVGVVGGGATGLAVGLAVAGPIGAVIGGVIGAVVGGVGGNAAAPQPAEPTSYEPLMVPPTHQQIAERAWQYFERDGRSDGHDFDDWVRAEADLYREALAARDQETLVSTDGH